MTAHLPSALAFSIVAALAVALAGRREATGSDRLSAAALMMLLGLPLLGLLPGWTILPSSESAGAGRATTLLGWSLPLGTALGLLRLLRASRLLSGWIRNSRPLGHRFTADGRRIQIRELPDLPSPCAAGVRRPVILVPPGWSSLPRDRRDMVLAHETAHHQRRDPLWRLLAALACALHWFNPLVWWLARRHALQAELACDAAVLAAGTPPDRYAHLLCDLARVRPTPLVAAMSGSMLGKRVDRLQSPTRHLSRFSLGLSLLLLFAAGFACGLSRPSNPVPANEIHLRLSANPFPANPQP